VNALQDGIECAGLLEPEGCPDDILGAGALAGARQDVNEAGAVARSAFEVLHDKGAHLAFTDVGSPLSAALVAVEVNNVVLQLKEHAELCEWGRKTSSIGSATCNDERSGDGQREERRGLAGNSLIVVVDVEALTAKEIELG
jgi:hypothetical protein